MESKFTKLESENQDYKLKNTDLNSAIETYRAEVQELRGEREDRLKRFQSRKEQMQEEIEDLQVKLSETETKYKQYNLDQSQLEFISGANHIHEQIEEYATYGDITPVNPPIHKMENLSSSMIHDFDTNRDNLLSVDVSELDVSTGELEMEITTLQTEVGLLKRKIGCLEDDKVRLEDQIETILGNNDHNESSVFDASESPEVIELKKQSKVWRERAIRLSSKYAEDVNELSEKLQYSLSDIRSLKYELDLLN